MMPTGEYSMNTNYDVSVVIINYNSKKYIDNLFESLIKLKHSDFTFQIVVEAGHLPENLLSYEETPGASETINKWVDEGHEVFIITGRPFNSYEPSRKWLDEHHLERVPLFCVDKYGREIFEHEYEYNMTLEQLYSMTFDFAIEDSPSAFEHVLHFNNCKVAVFDRPWNRQAEFPNDNFVRCKNWNQIDKLFEEYAGNVG